MSGAIVEKRIQVIKRRATRIAGVDLGIGLEVANLIKTAHDSTCHCYRASAEKRVTKYSDASLTLGTRLWEVR
jgi:hypothetical protein